MTKSLHRLNFTSFLCVSLNTACFFRVFFLRVCAQFSFICLCGLVSPPLCGERNAVSLPTAGLWRQAALPRLAFIKRWEETERCQSRERRQTWNRCRRGTKGRHTRRHKEMRQKGKTGNRCFLHPISLFSILCSTSIVFHSSLNRRLFSSSCFSASCHLNLLFVSLKCPIINNNPKQLDEGKNY